MKTNNKWQNQEETPQGQMWRGCKEANKVRLQGTKRNRYSVWGVDVQLHTDFTSVLD
jgi:hypothetical protein